MNRPYIICHMMQSVDGRVACDMVDKISGDEYYDALDALDCSSQIESKHSYQLHYCGFDEFQPEKAGGIDSERWFVANKEAIGYSRGGATVKKHQPPGAEAERLMFL